tara:strand:- start:21 stop:224 length:204 start_codon:yes stop_codon:yes gene_type:complete
MVEVFEYCPSCKGSTKHYRSKDRVWCEKCGRLEHTKRNKPDKYYSLVLGMVIISVLIIIFSIIYAFL